MPTILTSAAGRFQILLTLIPNSLYPCSKGEDDVNDPNFVMDCDFEENLKEKTQREIVESTRRGSRRRKSRFAQALERKKPSFDPEKGRVDHSIYGWHH